MTDTVDHVNEGFKHTIDVASAGTVVGALAGWLPEVAALFTIIWTSIRIFESKTVQSFLSKRKKGKDQC
jgi:hypothetical protein